MFRAFANIQDAMFQVFIYLLA